jgi:hypothetical protein
VGRRRGCTHALGRSTRDILAAATAAAADAAGEG